MTIESGHATLAHHEASRVRDAAYELLQLEGGDLHDPAQTRQTDAATPAAFRMGMLSIDNFPPWITFPVPWRWRRRQFLHLFNMATYGVGDYDEQKQHDRYRNDEYFISVCRCCIGSG
jgi:hypothetical protein